MNGKDLKRIMRQAGCSVGQLARFMGETETKIRQLQREDSDYYYFSVGADVWRERAERASNMLRGAYATK